MLEMMPSLVVVGNDRHNMAVVHVELVLYDSCHSPEAQVPYYLVAYHEVPGSCPLVAAASCEAYLRNRNT